jgi:hypothetical protein
MFSMICHSGILYQDVFLRKVTLGRTARNLADSHLRRIRLSRIFLHSVVCLVLQHSCTIRAQ